MFNRILAILLMFGSVSVQAAELQDPTKPDYLLTNKDPNPAVVENALVLSAIWITPNGRRATINGITVRQGQTLLNNIKIIKITHNTVSLKYNDSIKILRLLQNPYNPD